MQQELTVYDVPGGLGLWAQGALPPVLGGVTAIRGWLMQDGAWMWTQVTLPWLAVDPP
jgi:hypothetical protein